MSTESIAESTANERESAAERIARDMGSTIAPKIDGFTEEQVREFMGTGAKLAALSIAHTLARHAESAGNHKLGKKIRRSTGFKCSGYTSMTFEEIKWTLCISIVPTDSSYRMDIRIPRESYEQELIKQIVFTRAIAESYSVQYAIENPRIIKKLSVICPGVDFSRLVVEETNPCSMYYDKESSHRVAIFCYYLDEDGKPIMKNSTSEPDYEGITEVK